MRGVDSVSSISDSRKTVIDTAIWSAYKALHLLLSDDSLSSSIIGMPLYKHALLTFCAALLLKAASRWDKYITIDSWQVIDVVERSVQLFTAVRANRRHIIWHIGNGLTKALQQARGSLEGRSQSIEIDQITLDFLNDDLVVDGFNFASSQWIMPTMDGNSHT